MLPRKGFPLVFFLDAPNLYFLGVRDTIDLISKYGGKAHGFTCDLTNREEIYRTASIIKRTIGNVTILINNAGIVFGKTLLDLPDDEIDTTFQVNILAHYWVNIK